MKKHTKPQTGKPIKYPCDKHPGRIAATVVKGKLMCWECYLGSKPFVNRFGSDFYKQADATWLIENPEKELTK